MKNGISLPLNDPLKGCMPKKAGAGVPYRPADTFYKKWLHFAQKSAILQKDALMKTESV